MDEIDGMNNGDRGGINAIIKIVRPKKTKKQKLEDTSINPIICIGNKHADKKINEFGLRSSFGKTSYFKFCILSHVNTF